MQRNCGNKITESSRLRPLYQGGQPCLLQARLCPLTSPPTGHPSRGPTPPCLPLPPHLPSTAPHLAIGLHSRLPEMLEAKPLTVINQGDSFHPLPHLQGTEEHKVPSGCPVAEAHPSSGQMLVCFRACIATTARQGWTQVFPNRDHHARPESWPRQVTLAA